VEERLDSETSISVGSISSDEVGLYSGIPISVASTGSVENGLDSETSFWWDQFSLDRGRTQLWDDYFLRLVNRHENTIHRHYTGT
jgi:hypothetical protein